jgi:putative ABC transport system permease protein
MFKNFLKTTLRNLLRYKGFTFINISSLVIGITGCLVIALFVWDERQYDKFVTGGENVYRIYNHRTDNVSATNVASVPPMFATYIKNNYPEVESAMRIIMLSGKNLVEVGEKQAYEEKGLLTDGSFFEIFPLKMLKGEYKGVLDHPDAVILTEHFAKKYFRDQDPVGKTIKIDKTDFIVRGVLEKIPEHFHLDINYLGSYSSLNLAETRMQSWSWQQFYTYVRLKPGSDAKALEAKFQAGVKKESAQILKDGGSAYTPYLQPLKDVHLESANFEYDLAKGGNGSYLKGLTIIALFVLVIACFNFINLATARSLRRAKEIGVRKVVGALRTQLLVQFTGETIFLSIVAMLIAAVLTILIIPSLNSFTGKSISQWIFLNPMVLIALLVAAVVVGILAGIYPAAVLSGFQPIRVLKGLKATTGTGGAWLRQGLVIIQFALSTLLIISTMMVYRQINYLNNKDLGFSKDQIIHFTIQGGVANNIEGFKNELKRSHQVSSVTSGYGLPGDIFAGDQIIVPGKDGEKKFPTNLFIADHDYIKTLSLHLIAGRDFSKEITTDVDEAFIINETGVKELGFGTPQAAIGQRLHWNKWDGDSVNPVKKGRVIGVVKDFHYKSLHEKISISVLQIYPPIFYKIAVKTKTADLNNTLGYIEGVWKKYAPEYPLDYKFLDENFAEMYKNEARLGRLLLIFTVMAIVVGCMGLLGLATFSAEQRKREISIRKVLGASVMNIVALLSGNFLKPVFVASLIAFPLAWWAMSKWLEDYSYRVNISWWVFGITVLVALIIALITVSFQSIRAASSNPVKSLRSE